ncbi:MAG: glycosyltransferase family 2 protein [Candidatus Micrarchaeota archaeon]|nr:glycosyltransferase family 2 protein [Candidatus Micrarchaeota archaeon]
MTRGKVAIFIPAYNEERTIGSVVLLAGKYGRVFVIDDGSDDKTTGIARKAGAGVIAHRKNMGYGAALKSALAAARKMDAAAFVFMDADGQHDADEIPAVAGPVLDGTADLCQGSRFLGKFVSAPVGRREGVAFINRLTSAHNGKKEVDAQCGFRAISREAAGKIAIGSDGYAGCADMVSSAQHLGLRVAEVPVHVKYFPERNNPFQQGAGLVDYVAGQVIRKNPLALFAGIGTAMLAVSALLGVFVVDTFYTRHELATGSAFLTVFFGIAGMIMVLIGLNLYTLKKMLEERGRQ